VPLTEEVKTKVEIKCDGPDCPISYNWINEEVGKDAEKLPDPVYRFLILAEFMDRKWIFCSKYCMLQWLKKYEAPKSPREKRVAEEEAKAVQDAKDKEAQRLLEIAENEGLPSST
jgi:hypothetical protein